LAVTIGLIGAIFFGGSGKNHFDRHNPYRLSTRAAAMLGCNGYANLWVEVIDKTGQKRGGFFDVRSLYLKFVIADCYMALEK
jgi:hypothetical protein